MSARQKISLRPGRLVGLLRIAARDLEGSQAPRPLALAEDAGLGDRPPEVARVGRPTRASRHWRTRRARPIAEQDRDPAEVRIPAAAIHLAEGSPERAIELLAPVAERSVESLIPTWAAIHALLFDAAAREEIGDRRDAEAALERALDLAEPEGLILPFTIIPVQGLLEPLSAASDRPRRVPVNNPRRATNTIRTHLRHIYAKLGVHRRAEAVARARELELLAPSHRRRQRERCTAKVAAPARHCVTHRWRPSKSRKVSDDSSHPAVSSSSTADMAPANLHRPDATTT